MSTVETHPTHYWDRKRERPIDKTQAVPNYIHWPIKTIPQFNHLSSVYAIMQFGGSSRLWCVAARRGGKQLTLEEKGYCICITSRVTNQCRSCTTHSQSQSRPCWKNGKGKNIWTPLTCRSTQCDRETDLTSPITSNWLDSSKITICMKWPRLIKTV